MREARQQRRERQGTARMQVQEAERSGSLVIEAKGVGFGYGDGEPRPVIRDLTTTIMRGDKVGIIGPNGSGKTTLLRLLLGQLPPREGTVRHGTNLEVAYFDQLKAALDEEKTVQQNVSEYETIPINGQPRHVLGYLQDFLFPPERSRSLVKFLSGGERSRLLLAKLFTRPSNVLVLDEPTNDLDIETLELLETPAGGLPGDGAPGQPRPGVPQRRGDQHAGDRGRRRGSRSTTAATTTTCASGRTRPPAEPKAAPAPAPSAPTPAGRAAPQAELQGDAGAGSPARPDRGAGGGRAGLHDAMADPAFYRQDGGAIAEAKARLEALERELAAAYERWEALEGARRLNGPGSRLAAPSFERRLAELRDRSSRYPSRPRPRRSGLRPSNFKRNAWGNS